MIAAPSDAIKAKVIPSIFKSSVEGLNARNNPINVVKNCFYKLNIWNESYTADEKFYHKVEGAYKYYQIKSINEKKNKIAKQFALRRILNRKYEHWKINNLNKGYYEFIVEYLK